ncbi:hypothetical protein DPMN_028550 [Dreissena polymorpha]|uniref:Uncharacterized protein n=1 Tax=Dreissena polymorpha TaxID=45954 RepID=A0A9D4LZ60_DREPO|nr:hypothetical protein DPMN_028550 [Dreissena polymorpha]
MVPDEVCLPPPCNLMVLAETYSPPPNDGSSDLMILGKVCSPPSSDLMVPGKICSPPPCDQMEPGKFCSPPPSDLNSGKVSSPSPSDLMV